MVDRTIFLSYLSTKDQNKRESFFNAKLSGRYGSGSGNYNSNGLLVFGGFNEAGQALSELWAFQYP